MLNDQGIAEIRRRAGILMDLADRIEEHKKLGDQLHAMLDAVKTFDHESPAWIETVMKAQPMVERAEALAAEIDQIAASIRLKLPKPPQLEPEVLAALAQRMHRGGELN